MFPGKPSDVLVGSSNPYGNEGRVVPYMDNEWDNNPHIKVPGVYSSPFGASYQEHADQAEFFGLDAIIVDQHQ